ncbi:MAG: hypothetical protein QNJ98_02540 [Planctomycetota bacterium]|nr:hypothetical protein [Planctomycetota bacterium]
MGRLQRRLDAIKKGFHEQAPAEAIEAMSRATAELQTDVDGRGLEFVGKPLPAFELPDSQGNTVRSADLLAGGPLVVALFRGTW